MNDNLSKRAKEIIEEIFYFNIATVNNDSQPWNSMVYGAYDDAYNFYWGSHKESQHSNNIRANNKVFVTIYDSTTPAGEGEGVYILAEAKEVAELEEIKKAHRLIQDRRPIPYWRLNQMYGATPVRIYKAVPKKVWMNVEGEKNGHYIDMRQEISL